MGKRDRARARAAKLAPEGPPAEHPAIAPLLCTGCGAPVPLGDADLATCSFCHAEVPVPEPYRALRDAERQRTTDREAAETLYRTLGSPPSAALRAWASAAQITSGALFGAVMLVLTVSAAFILLAGFALELVLHALAHPLGIDLIDRFGGGVVYGGFVVAVVLFGFFPNWLVGYLDSLAEIKRTLQVNLAAIPPKRKGFPSTCRGCGAALDVPPGAMGVRCAYCQTDNLVSLPQKWIEAAGVKQAHFHRSIIDAAARARALRKEVRAGLPTTAKWLAGGILAFGLIGKCSVSLDSDEINSSFSDGMGPPRKMIPYWAPEKSLPIESVDDFPHLPYTVALHHREVLQWSSPDDGWGGRITIKNTTTFPLLTRQDEAPWLPQTDGTFAARYTAPYTGLFQVKLETNESDETPVHLRWRIGADSVPGVPAPPPMTVEPAEAVAPAPLAERAQAAAGKLGARLVANPPGRSDLLATSGGHDGPNTDLVLSSISKGTQLVKMNRDVVIVLAASNDGHRIATASPERVSAWWIAEVERDSYWKGPFVDSAGVTALAFIHAKIFASGDGDGVIKVWNSDTGMQLYQVPGKLPGAVTSLAVSPDGTALIAGFAGGARRFVVSEPAVWGRHR